MANGGRTYIKNNPEKEQFSVRATSAGKPVEIQLAIKEERLPGYQKTDIDEMPKAFFVIISGGQVREINYFKILSHKDRFNRIKLQLIADPLKLTPDGMLELAEIKKAHFNSSRNEDAKPDRIYLISDVDHFINELLRIKPICEREDFKLIISNSCFEVWLYYAYHNTIPAFRLPEDPLKISSKFKGWLPSVIRGGIKPEKAILQIQDNIANAKKNYKEGENGIPELFSTTMYILAQDLIPLIEPELSNIIEEKTKVTEHYKLKP